MSTMNFTSVLHNERARALTRLLLVKSFVRVLETHNALSGMIVEQSCFEEEGGTRQFDALWFSSLTDSTSRGKPDTDTVDFSARTATLKEILSATTKPVIFDANTGGAAKEFDFIVKELIDLGVSAVVIEDKCGAKKNSLCENTTDQKQATIADFSEKISIGRARAGNSGFMIIARIESFILGSGLYDALNRANEYVNAGASGILIHSKLESADEVLLFAQHFRIHHFTIPLFVVPTTYEGIHENDLSAASINVVIYANQLLRAAYPAMRRAAQQILRNGTASELGQDSATVFEILSIVEGNL